MHKDEAYIHLHAYVLPSASEMRAKALHPGEVAKLTCQAAAIASGDNKKLANKKGDAAYLQAMREFQNEYWLYVGLPSGQLRVGPRRRRWTRVEWHAEKSKIQLWNRANDDLSTREKELQSKIDQQSRALERYDADQKLEMWREEAASANPGGKPVTGA
jgi:hypothetical protein